MGQRYRNMMEVIDNTPVVRIDEPGPEYVNLDAKIELFNPLGLDVDDDGYLPTWLHAP